jgi:hypothetical protein
MQLRGVFTVMLAGSLVIAFIGCAKKVTGPENTKPAITTQPTAQAVASGASAAFTVVATGVPAPTYQWQKDGVNCTGASATTATFTLAAAAVTDAGTYTVIVTNAAGSVTSSGATLSVTPPIDVWAIYTDTGTTAKFNNGYNLYIWGNTGTFQTPPAETKFGANTLQFVVGTLGWGGIGFQPKGADTATGVDISAYKTMHFWIKSNATGKITACFSSLGITGNAPALDISAYGYVADNAWHEINIPLADWTGTDLTKANVYAGFVVAGTTGGENMFLDDIWYAK